MDMLYQFRDSILDKIPYWIFQMNKYWVHKKKQIDMIRNEYMAVNLILNGIQVIIDVLYSCIIFVVNQFLYDYQEPGYQPWISTHSYSIEKGYIEKYIPIPVLWTSHDSKDPNMNVYLENMNSAIRMMYGSLNPQDMMVLKTDGKYYCYLKKNDPDKIPKIEYEPCSFHFMSIELSINGCIYDVELESDWFRQNNEILSKTFVARYMNYLPIFRTIDLDLFFELRSNFTIQDYTIDIIDHNGSAFHIGPQQYIRLEKDDYQVITIE